jgi:hypothetical protein
MGRFAAPSGGQAEGLVIAAETRVPVVDQLAGLPIDERGGAAAEAAC